MDDKKSALLFQVTNHHVDGCGKPPSVNGDVVAYSGYYENYYGEQMLFVVWKGTKKAVIYQGDSGWDRPYEVRDSAAGGWVILQSGRMCGHIGSPTMNLGEQMFITACMEASRYLRTGSTEQTKLNWPNILGSEKEAEHVLSLLEGGPV